MGNVARPPDPIRDLLGLDPRLRNSLIHTGGRRRGPLDPWNEFGSAGQPSLNSPWGQPDPALGVHKPRWFRDERNIVHLSGMVVAATAPVGVSTVLTMPLRPTQVVRWLAASNAGPTYWSYVYIDTAGTIVVVPGSEWISLDGLSYPLT